MSYPPLRALTDLTGAEAAKDRTTVIATFEIRLPVLKAFLIGLLPGVLIGLFFGMFLGLAGGLFGCMAGVGAAMWLILGRSANGLQRQHWKTLKDMFEFHPGEVVLCGQPIDPLLTLENIMVHSTVPLLPESVGNIDAVLGLEDERAVERMEDVSVQAPVWASVYGVKHSTARHTPSVQPASVTFDTDDVLAHR